MDRLWSPWRSTYVTSATDGDTACIFCDTTEPGRDEPWCDAVDDEGGDGQ